MINKTELKDVVLRFQSKTDISIKDIFGEAPSKEQEKMWVKFLKEYFKIEKEFSPEDKHYDLCLLYTSPSPRDATLSRMPSSA